MDWYKKIFKNQSLRMKILKFFEWVPDSVMVRIQYFIKMGRILNLDNPKTFTEKIQWYKLNYRIPLMTKCVDKHAVKKLLEEKCSLPVNLVDERLSTVEAESILIENNYSRAKRKNVIDELSACIILDTYLRKVG